MGYDRMVVLYTYYSQQFVCCSNLYWFVWRSEFDSFEPNPRLRRCWRLQVTKEEYTNDEGEADYAERASVSKIAIEHPAAEEEPLRRLRVEAVYFLRPT